MDLGQNDPGELMNQISKMSEKFVQLNKDGRFEIMPGAKRQLREISSALGISYDNLTKMAIGTKDLETKLSKIAFPSSFTEEQRQMIANLAELGPGGEMTLRVGTEEMGINKAMELFAKDDEAMKKFMEDSEPKTMEQLAKDQLTIAEHGNIILEQIRDRTGYGLASSKGFETLVSAQKDVQTALINSTKNSVLSEKGMRQGIGNLGDDLLRAMADKDEKKISEVKNKIAEQMTTLGKEFVENPKKAYENLLKSDNPVLKMLLGAGAEKGVPTTTTNVSELTAQGQLDKWLGKQTTTTATPTTETAAADAIQKAKEQSAKMETSQSINYSGKLDVNFTAPPGVNMEELKTLINQILNSNEFREKIAMIAKDPQGKNTPSQTNMAFPR
jgi:hypothetical protein